MTTCPRCHWDIPHRDYPHQVYRVVGGVIVKVFCGKGKR